MAEAMRFDDDAFLMAMRVYYEDTDAGGIVYYANYMKFAERARTEALRAIGIHQSDLLAEQGLAFVVAEANIRFFKPARLDDVITIQTRLQEMRKVRMSMQQSLWRGEDKLVELHTQIAMIDAQGKPAPIPEAMAAKLLEYLPISSSPDSREAHAS